MARLFVNCGSDVNAIDHEGSRADWAERRGSALVQLLKDHGANGRGDAEEDDDEEEERQAERGRARRRGGGGGGGDRKRGGSCSRFRGSGARVRDGRDRARGECGAAAVRIAC